MGEGEGGWLERGQVNTEAAGEERGREDRRATRKYGVALSTSGIRMGGTDGRGGIGGIWSSSCGEEDVRRSKITRVSRRCD